MESLPAYMFWSAVGVITLVSFFLGGVMIGLALVGRRSHKARAPETAAAPIYQPAETLLEADPHEPLPFFLNPDQLHRTAAQQSFPAPLA